MHWGRGSYSRSASCNACFLESGDRRRRHVKHDVVPSVYGRSRRAEGVQGPHNHVRVLITVELGGWGNDAIVHVALIVEDGAASRSAADEGDVICGGG